MYIFTESTFISNNNYYAYATLFQAEKQAYVNDKLTACFYW